MRPKKVILCVDDNEQELSVLKFMLSTNGYRVVSALTGQEAIGLFADNALRFGGVDRGLGPGGLSFCGPGDQGQADFEGGEDAAHHG